MLVLTIPGSFNNPYLPKLQGRNKDRLFGEVRLDFGNTTYWVNNWNKIGIAGGLATTNATHFIEPVLSCINSSGENTAISVLSDGNWRPGTSTSNSTEFPENLGNDYFFVGDVNSLITESAELYFDGFSTKRLYSIEIYSARSGITSPRISYFSANGVTGSLDAMENTSDTCLLENVAADENGRITFKLSRYESTFAYINAMIIREQV